jgi:hypothetical protein
MAHCQTDGGDPQTQRGDSEITLAAKRTISCPEGASSFVVCLDPSRNLMPTTSEYLLLFRGTHWYKGLSPAEIQKVMSRWRAWYDALQAQGKMKGGLPLMNEGKIVSGARGRYVTDGPFTESKEAIGGYFLICVDNPEEAIEIARQCPGLEHGAVVEIRPVARECAASELARENEGTYANA